MTLGTRIRTQRKSIGMSQEKLAERLGISRQAVAKWENDRSIPTADNLLALAAIFDTTVGALLDEQPQQAQSIDMEALAAELHALQQAEKAERQTVRQAERQKRLCAAALVLGLFVTAWLLGRILWGTREDTSFVGWLLGSDSTSYLYGWLVDKKLWWMAAGITCVCAGMGKYRAAWVCAGSFFVGLALGERFGPFPAGAPWGHGHYGWAIWALQFMFGLCMGLWAERLHGREASEKIHRLWTVVYAAGMVLIVVFVQSQMIVPTGH